MEPSVRDLDHSHQSKLALLSRGMDGAVILLALWIGTALHGVAWTERYFVAGILALLLFEVSGQSNRLHHSWCGALTHQYLQPVVAAWLWTGCGLFVVAWMTKSTADYSRVAVGFWMILAPFGLLSWRVLGRSLLGAARERGRDAHRTAIVGANRHGERFARVVRSTPSLGLTLAGFFDDRRTEYGWAEERELSAPLLGDVDALVDSARAGRLDLVFITLPMKAEEEIHRLIHRLSDTRVSIHIVPDLFVHGLAHSRWINVGAVSVISVFDAPFSGVDGWTKRCEDIVLSIFILLLTALPMLLIASAVKLTSRGPVLFRQRRYGLDGREITVSKFRTMTVGEDGDVVTQARKGDDRVTPFGAFLRRTSLDELPQFINVLLGNMSIVGPRPHAVAHNEEYRELIPGYMLRHKVKPGITGWAQVNGWRGETDTLDKMERRVQFDLWYIRNWSLRLDLRIITKTVFQVFVDENAY